MATDSSFQQSYRFTKAHRLLKTDEFSSVFSLGKRFRGDVWSLLLTDKRHPRLKKLDTPILPMPQEFPSRLGVVVGKKHLKRAVDRNRAKRVARAWFRSKQWQLPLGDYVLRLDRPIRSTSTGQFKQICWQDFQRLESQIRHFYQLDPS